MKQTSAHDVCRAIREVQAGKTFFSPSIARHFNRLNPSLAGRAGALNPKTAELTSREMEVLQLIAEGKANKETAHELGIGNKTVEKHREHLMQKLDIHDTTGLTRYAISAGIIESSRPIDHYLRMNWTPLNITVRVGCQIAYDTTVPTSVLFVLRPRLEGKVLVMQEKLSFGIGLPSYEFQDSHGNVTYRSTLMPGRNEIRHDALVAVSSLPDNRQISGNILSVGQLPFELLRYTLPSRYCDSDKLMNFAWNLFGQIQHGLPRVQAICDWVHNNIEYRYMSGRPDLSASEIIARRFGVCRDFAHTAIALCRAFNLPARYVTGHFAGHRLQ